MKPRVITVLDVRECDVEWLDELSTRLRLVMGSQVVYEGDVKPEASFDFVGHAYSLGVIPDDESEFIHQLRSGLDALAAAYQRNLH